ncbi:MAG: ABC transporter ATP-binding protein [Thermoplasmatota archaeon]
MAVAIETQGLSKDYGSTRALAPLNLRVNEGEVFGYLGPNGAGKTTTIRLLLGLIRPTAGKATIFGLDTDRDKVALHRKIAYVPGEATLWPSLTGAETLHLLGRVHGSVDQAYRDDLIRRFEFDPNKKVRAYSKGNRQKLILIAGLMVRAPLLIMDEPTSGLDPLMERVFRECVKEAKARGQTVFLSSHQLSDVEVLCERVGLLRQGRLVDVGALKDFRHLSALEVMIETERPPPVLNGVEGVSRVEVEGRIVRCRVTGSFDPVLDRLRPAGIVRMTSHEPSLEEIFLARYGGSAPPETRERTSGR